MVSPRARGHVTSARAGHRLGPARAGPGGGSESELIVSTLLAENTLQRAPLGGFVVSRSEMPSSIVQDVWLQNGITTTLLAYR